MPHYNDIQKYTRDGHYRIDVSLDYLEHLIERYTDDYDAELNPDFQRGHVWDEGRQIAFVEHILRGGKGSNEIRFNCPDWGSGARRKMVLVDGLQRVTACMRFLQNEIPAFGHLHSEWDGLARSDIGLVVRVNDLKTREEVLRWYLEINTGGVVHTDEEISKVRKLLEIETNR